jgi:hypothetical protein
MTSAAMVTVINYSDGYGHLHVKPPKPVLVLFLENRSNTKQGSGLSFVTVEIDQLTGPDQALCDCHKDKGATCRVVSIQRDRGQKRLQAQIYHSLDFQSWDVTRMGMEKRQELPVDEAPGMRKVSIRFKSPYDRQFFSSSPCQCAIDFQKNDIVASILGNCLASDHQGIYGRVKEFGRQELDDWNSAHDPGDEFVNSPIPQ